MVVVLNVVKFSALHLQMIHVWKFAETELKYLLNAMTGILLMVMDAVPSVKLKLGLFVKPIKNLMQVIIVISKGSN
jgi:hypothetical protein